MERRYSIAAFGLSLLIGASCVSSTLIAAERDVAPTKTAGAVVSAKGTPRIQFETNFYDFGKVTAPGTLSGVFKFRNVGDGILRVDPPEPGCDCTGSKVKPDTLAPGESGEILYKLNLERAVKGQRHMRVHCNDPKTPDVQLTMQMDYTPLYEVSPTALRMMLPVGKEKVQGHVTVTRTDGKPLQIDRLTASQEWIHAAFDVSFKPEDSSARINVTLQRPAAPPSPLIASVQMWNSNLTTQPVKTVYLTGDIEGEVVAVPPRLYWVIPDLGKVKADYPAEALTKTIEVKSVLGNPVKLRNPASSIKGMSVQIVPRQTGNAFDLVLTFAELPQSFTNGKVTVETSLASLPRLEVPMTIAVPDAK